MSSFEETNGPFGIWNFPVLKIILGFLESIVKNELVSHQLPNSHCCGCDEEVKPKNQDFSSQATPHPIPTVENPSDYFLPYHNIRTLSKGEIVTEEIKDDYVKGLRTVGRSGVLQNAGPGDMGFKIFDGVRWSDWIELPNGTTKNFLFEDGIFMHTLKLKTEKTNAATYDLTINPGVKNE